MGMLTAASLDPGRALWVPGKVAYSIPKVLKPERLKVDLVARLIGDELQIKAYNSAGAVVAQKVGTIDVVQDAIVVGPDAFDLGPGFKVGRANIIFYPTPLLSLGDRRVVAQW